MICRAFVEVALVALSSCQPLFAADVRFYDEGGVTYRESRRTVSQSIPETRIVEQSRTVNRLRPCVDVLEVPRTVHVPVTECRRELYWRGRFNPFVQPYLVERVVPRTRWEVRTTMLRVPVTRWQTVPETLTVQVPVTSYRVVEHDITTRTPVDQPRTSLARRPSPLAADAQWGGIANLDRDPPRSGLARSEALGPGRSRGPGGLVRSQEWRSATQMASGPRAAAR